MIILIFTVKKVRTLKTPWVLMIFPIFTALIILVSTLLPIELSKYVELEYVASQEQELASLSGLPDTQIDYFLIEGYGEDGTFYLFTTIENGRHTIHQIPTSQVQVYPVAASETGRVVILEPQTKDQTLRFFVVLYAKNRYELHIPLGSILTLHK